MAMQLARTATSGVVGVGSGVLGSGIVQPLELGGTKIGFDTIFEVVALLGGAVMQFAAPHTMPNVADGLVDGGLALGARRLTGFALAQTGVGQPAAMYGARAARSMQGARAYSQMGAGSAAYARPAIGSVGVVSKQKLT